MSTMNGRGGNSSYEDGEAPPNYEVKNIIAQFTPEQGDPIGPQMQLPVNISNNQLDDVLNKLLKNVLLFLSHSKLKGVDRIYELNMIKPNPLQKISRRRKEMEWNGKRRKEKKRKETYNLIEVCTFGTNR